MVKFGQVVMGPPGSGKSTYCAGAKQLMNSLGRAAAIVNLDPQVTSFELPYTPDVDICELVDSSNVADTFELGPNASLLYAMDYLLANLDWLTDKITGLGDVYVLYDIPGQIELFTHHTALKDIIETLQRKHDHRLSGVNLIDSTLCADPFKYVAALLTSLSCQIFIQLPHVNVLSKLDLLSMFSKELAFNLEFYTSVSSLEELINFFKQSSSYRHNKRFEKFTAALCELIDDFNLVSFATLDVQNRSSMIKLIKLVDRATGYVSGPAFDDFDLDAYSDLDYRASYSDEEANEESPA
ncbi:GPN-loop GTPase 2 [Babesia sp. Xinjiang]|uniref:GPN-loop GTPase 2 n=1 Tax=Babesia sp. Xinjiang TaxID=462227 RepID=UPI000A223BDE|nr:GPN-loop GTPase 2 [Babesia sp. Xinjiang]ORM39832.1 GPN-loop GTPase 2 [Babesia sp. Xinjiang]